MDDLGLWEWLERPASTRGYCSLACRGKSLVRITLSDSFATLFLGQFRVGIFEFHVPRLRKCFLWVAIDAQSWLRSRELGSESQDSVQIASSRLCQERRCSSGGRASASATGPVRGSIPDPDFSFAHFLRILLWRILILLGSNLITADISCLKCFQIFGFCKTRQFDVSSSERGITPRVFALQS